MSEGDALGNIKSAFEGTRGKVLLIGGGLAVAAYVWYSRTHPAAEEPLPADPTVPETGTGNGFASPQETPSVGNQVQGDSKRRPESNGEWQSAGTDFLIGRGVPGAQAYDALSKALAGLALTTQQIAWVSQVIGTVGSPPEGMPPMNASAPPTTGTTQTAMKAPTALKAEPNRVYRLSLHLDWQPVAGVKGYWVYMNGKQKVSTVYSSSGITGLKPNTAYQFDVRGIYAGNKIGPKSNVVSVRTKK